MTERRADCCCYCYEVGGRHGQGWTCGRVQHCNNSILQEGLSLTHVNWKKFRRQRDHYDDDEADTDRCVPPVPVSTSSSSHDSPPDDAVYGPVVASLGKLGN